MNGRPLTNVPIPTTLMYPPRTIQDEHGQVVGVVLSQSDYRLFLRILAAYADWDTLPSYLQDAIDNVLADEAQAEEGEARPFRDLLPYFSNTTRPSLASTRTVSPSVNSPRSSASANGSCTSRWMTRLSGRAP